MRVRSVCLLGVQVAVEVEEWMVLAIDKYDYGIFLKKGLRTAKPLFKLSHYEKVLKACDIVWFVSSACNLRRHWPECVGRVDI